MTAETATSDPWPGLAGLPDLGGRTAVVTGASSGLGALLHPELGLLQVHCQVLEAPDQGPGPR